MSPSTLSPQQLELLEDAAFFGIRCGFTIPIHDGRGAIAAVTYASQSVGGSQALARRYRTKAIAKVAEAPSIFGSRKQAH
jgi:hypothetical protein